MRGRISAWLRLLTLGAVFTVATGALVAPPAVSAAAATSAAASKSTQKAATPAKKKKKRSTAKAAAPPLSYGQRLGLHATPDPLALKSGAALVVDQDTDEVLFSKNPQVVLPIASLTKLMTAMVVLEAEQPLDEVLVISQADVDSEKHSPSRLRVGTRLTRAEMLHLALMSSENRAAHALGRNFPGGRTAFVAAMNRKARALGMQDTSYVDPTGLSSRNQSSAKDLAVLVKAAYGYDMIRSLSTSPEAYVTVSQRALHYRNSNLLVQDPEWTIGLQKTGYIIEAGRCLVMQADLAGRKLILVLLDSTGQYSRFADARRIRNWLNDNSAPTRLAQSLN